MRHREAIQTPAEEPPTAGLRPGPGNTGPGDSGTANGQPGNGFDWWTPPRVPRSRDTSPAPAEPGPAVGAQVRVEPPAPVHQPVVVHPLAPLDPPVVVDPPVPVDPPVVVEPPMPVVPVEPPGPALSELPAGADPPQSGPAAEPAAVPEPGPEPGPEPSPAGHAEVYRHVHQGEEFQEIRRTYRRFVFPACAVFLAWYLGYIVAAVTLPGLMARPVAGPFNVAWALGLLQFLTTFLITWLYARHARDRRDRAALGLRWETQDRLR